MATYQLSEQDYIESCLLAWRLTKKQILLFNGSWLAIFLLLMPTLSRHDDILTHLPVALVILVLLNAMLLFLLRKSIIPRFAKKNYRQYKALHQPCEFTWNDEGVSISNATGSSFTPWNDYHQIRENDSLILLYLNGSLFQAIPKRVFSSDASLAEFKARLPRADSVRRSPGKR